MAHRPKSVVVTFRVDAHLAEALERVPDKSAFIREALQQSLHEPCPACNGVGRVDCDAAVWLRAALTDLGARNCACCGAAYPAAAAAHGNEPSNSAPTTASKGTASKNPAKRTAEQPSAETCGHCGPEGHRH